MCEVDIGEIYLYGNNGDGRLGHTHYTSSGFLDKTTVLIP